MTHESKDKNSSSHDNEEKYEREEEEENIEFENEDGAHDTITSLAGVQMLQKYRRKIAGVSPELSSFSVRDTVPEEEPLSIPDSPPKIDSTFVPPNGGYGWIISLGAFWALFWASGLIKSYGLLFSEILEAFPDSSVSLASWIPASMTTLALALAPIASALCQKYTCRAVTFAGSLLCSTGVLLSIFATDIRFLFFSFGVITGLGLGLSTTPGIILTARYFDTRRHIANMFCLTGSAAGSFILPFCIKFWSTTYGYKGTLLLLGSCMLHISVSAALYRPLNIHILIQKKKKEKEEKKEMNLRKENYNQKNSFSSSSSLTHNDSLLTLQSFRDDSLPPSLNESLSWRPRSCTTHFSEAFPFSFRTISEEGLPRQILGSSVPLSLHDLRLHQIGSRLTLYKKRFLGSHSSSSFHKRRNSSFSMFSCEDLGTDSSSILKDSFPPPGCGRATLSRGGGALSGESGGAGSGSGGGALSERHNSEEKREKTGLQSYLNVTIIKDPLFLIMALSVMGMTIGVPHLLFFLPSYSVSLGHDDTVSILLLSSYSVSDLMGRISVSLLLNVSTCSRHFTYSFVIFLSGLSVVLLPVVSSHLYGLYSLVVFYGLFSGSWFVMVPLLLSEYLGVENIGSSYGFVRLFQSVANLLGPLLAGTLRDWTGNYDESFFFMGSCMILGSLPPLFYPLAHKIHCQRSK